MKTNFFKGGREAGVWFLGFEWKSFPQVCLILPTETSVAEADWGNVVCKFINTSLFCGKQ